MGAPGGGAQGIDGPQAPPNPNVAAQANVSAGGAGSPVGNIPGQGTAGSNKPPGPAPITVIKVDGAGIHLSNGTVIPLSSVPAIGPQGPAGPGTAPPGAAGATMPPGFPTQGPPPVTTAPNTVIFSPQDYAGFSKGVQQQIAARDQMATSKDQAGNSLLDPTALAGYGAARTKMIAAANTLQQTQDKFNNLQTLLFSGNANAITHVQGILNKAGFDVGQDGSLGPQTLDAFYRYQNQQLNVARVGANNAFQQADPNTFRAFGNAQLDKPIAPGKITWNQWYRTQSVQHLWDQVDQVTQAQQQLATQPGGIQSSTYKSNAAILKRLRELIAQLQEAPTSKTGVDNLTAKGIFENIMKQNAEQAAAYAKAQHDAWKASTGWRGVFQRLMLPTNPVGYTFDSFGRMLDAGMAATNLAKLGHENPFQQTLAGWGGVAGSFLDWFTGMPATFAGKAYGQDAATGLLGNTYAAEGIRLTETPQDRQQLVQDGVIESWGKYFTGNDTPQFRALFKGVPYETPDPAIGKVHLVSGGVDLLLGLIPGVKDPTGLITFGLSSGVNEILDRPIAQAAKDMADLLASYSFEDIQKAALAMVGPERLAEMAPKQIIDIVKNQMVQFAQRGVRDTFLHNDAIGRTLSSEIHRVVTDGVRHIDSVPNIRRTFKGMSSASAQRILDARNAAVGGADDIATATEAAIRAEFLSGAWKPDIGWVHGLTQKMIAGLGGDPTTEGTIGRAIKLNSWADYIRHLGQPKSVLASTYESDTMRFGQEALDVALRTANKTYNEAVNLVEGEGSRSIVDRFYAVGERVLANNLAPVSALWEGMVRPLFMNPDVLKKVPLVSYLDTVFADPAMEAVVQRMEIALGMLDGQFGEAAKAQFTKDMTMGFALPDNWIKDVMNLASGNLGIKLEAAAGHTPARSFVEDQIMKIDSPAVQRFFMARLDNATSKGDLRNLIRDVRAVKNNFDLNQEVQSIVLRSEQRAQLIAAQEAGKGFPQWIVEKASHFLTSLVDINPPGKVLFEDASKNRDVLFTKRAEAARQMLNGFHVTGAVADSIEHQIASANSETAFAHGMERLARVAAKANGIGDPNVILNILKEQGHFNPVKFGKSIIRKVGPDGLPIEDLQTLAQKMEAWKMPSPHEVAAAFNKAIRDGAVDVPSWRRVGARFSVVADKVGGIRLGHTLEDGSFRTLSSDVHAIHRMWKFLIVSNFGLPVIGAVSGFQGDKHGDLWHRMMMAAEGFGLGALGTTRFAFRTAMIDDRIRYILAAGPSADTMIPGYAALRTHFFASDAHDFNRRMMSGDLGRVGNYGENHWENDILTHVDDHWVVIQPSDRRAPDALARVVNDQFQPEVNPIDRILLSEKAGILPVQVKETPAREVKTGETLYEKRPLPTEPVGPQSTVAAPGYENLAAELDKLNAEPDLTAGMNANLDERFGVVGNNDYLIESFHAQNPEWRGDTQTYYRGEESKFAKSNRGEFWTEKESYAQRYAGDGGTVYAVDLPMVGRGDARRPAVGQISHGKDEGNQGWMLDTTDSTQWADAAVPQYVVATREETKMVGGGIVPESQREAADRMLAELAKTDQGKLLLERLKTGHLGPKSWKEAISRERDFIDTYTNADIALARVSGGREANPAIVAPSVLKRHLDEGTVAVNGIHGKNTWRIPRSWPEVFRRGDEVTKSLAKKLMSGPSNFLNRTPTQNIVFQKEYDRLINNGIAAEEAQRSADEYALEFVNGTFHRYDNASISAGHLDMFMPFQHAREDMVRFYGKMILEHPARTMRIAWGAARAFNNGKENGTFRKDPISGQWEINIPGMGLLSSALFGMPFDGQATTPLSDWLTIGAGAYIGGEKMVVPHLGGPFWTMLQAGLAKAFPQMVTNKSTWETWLFPFHSAGNFLSSSSSRLWMAFSGSAPPWEVLDRQYWKGEIDHWQREVGQEMMYQNKVHGSPKGINYIPTQEEVEQQTKNFFKVWSMYSALVPSSVYMSLPSQGGFQQAENAYTLGGIIPWDQAGFLKAYPQYAPFVLGDASTRYVGPEDMATLHSINYDGPYGIGTYDPTTGLWTPPAGGENYSNEERMGWRVPTDWSDYRQMFEQNLRTSQYYRAIANAKNIPDLWEREQKYSEISRQYADVIASQDRTQEIKSEVNAIMFVYPQGMKASAYKRVQATYGLSNTDLIKVQNQVNDPFWSPNPWAGTRDGQTLNDIVAGKFGRNWIFNPAAVKYIGTLRPTEQHNVLQYYMDATGYYGGDPTKYKPLQDNAQAIMQEYQAAKTLYDALYAQYPVLTPKNKVDTWQNPEVAKISAMRNYTYNTMQTVYTRINNLNNAINTAYSAKNYSAVDALTAQRDGAYNMLAAIRDQWLGNMPNLTKYYDDLHAMTIYEANGNNAMAENEYRQAILDAQSAPYILTSEQSRFMHMPATVQAAYVKTLVDGLNMPYDSKAYTVTQYVQQVTGLSHYFWSYLSPVQQNELTVMYPGMVDTWKYIDWWYHQGPGLKQKHFSKRGKVYYTPGLPLDISMIPHDLQYAYATLGKYDKRGKSAPPKDYQHYLSLPSNWAVKADFLQSHPDVKAYLQQGPLANMPTAEKDMVTSILVRYGQYAAASSGYSAYKTYKRSSSWVGLHPAHYNGSKYNGVPGPMGSGYADYKWAEYQLFAWDRRPQVNGKVVAPPPTYTLWLNMPSGPAKAEYLKTHPEVETWIKLGPMANMPQEYQDIVRSILVQYGDWTQTVNPLADTITQYFATPKYAQPEFLLQHPELEVYWSLTKTPQELAMQNLENSYFSIRDVQAKRAFLLAHPELQTHLLQAHEQRYETFLNQVASYMGGNPGMFEQYMRDQNAVLAELLQKFAMPSLLREKPIESVDASVGSGGGISSEGNRQRRTKGPGRARSSAGVGD